MTSPHPSSPSSARTPRAHHRVPVSLPVSLAAAHPRLYDVARDISEGGLGVLTTQPLSVGERVVVSVRVARGVDALEPAEVVWVRAGAMGLRFMDLAARTSDAIDGLRRGLHRA